MKLPKQKFILTLIILLNQTLYSQTPRPNTADKLFEDSKYNLAIKEYLELVKANSADSTHFQTKLGDCYYNLFNYREAILWYEKAIKNNADPEIIYRYAEMLKAAGNYDKASEQMQQFAKLLPNDSRTAVFLKSNNFIGFEEDEKEALYKLKPLKLNTSFEEFGGVVRGNKFYFISNRERKNAQKGQSDKTGINFTNVYNADLQNNEIININEFRELNTRWNDELLTFSNNSQMLFIASEQYNLVLSDSKKFKGSENFTDGFFAIFKSTFEKNSFWSNFEPLSFIEKEYSYKDPYLTSDGKTLYFSSNMPGGFGGMDLWKIKIYEDGTNGDPVNLGEKINTINDERTPFFDIKTNVIYFSSNGHLGFGGLDVFKYNFDDNAQEVINLGYPVSSKGNDFAFIYYPEKNIGFISSDRNGNSDIFEIQEIPVVATEIMLVDATKNSPLENVKATIKDKNGKVIDFKMSDKNGSISLMFPKNKELTIEISKDNFLSESINLTMQANNQDKKRINLALSSSKLKQDFTKMEFEILFDFNQFNINYEASIALDNIVALLQQNPAYKLLATTHTDTRGSEDYNLKLSQLRAKSVTEYLISKNIDAKRISIEGKGASMPKVNCLDNCSEEEHQKNRRTTFEFTKQQ